jgi:hypothetical protein
MGNEGVASPGTRSCTDAEITRGIVCRNEAFALTTANEGNRDFTATIAWTILIFGSVKPGTSGRGYKRLGSQVTGECFAAPCRLSRC